MKWGLTYNEQKALKKKKNKSFNSQKVNHGYQKHFALLPVILTTGKTIWLEWVYRHLRRTEGGLGSPYYDCEEATLSFRFHVLKGRDMTLAEQNKYRISRGWEEVYPKQEDEDE